MVIHISCASPKLQKQLDKELQGLYLEFTVMLQKAMTFEEFAKGKPSKRIVNTAYRWARLLAEPYRQVFCGKPLAVETHAEMTWRLDKLWMAFWGLNELALERILHEVREGKLNVSTMFNEREKQQFISIVKQAQTKMQALLEGEMNRAVQSSLRLVKG